MDLHEASEHVAAADPAMAALIDIVGPCTLKARPLPGGHFGALARSILYQQLAGKAAASIHARFLALFDGGTPTPEAVLALPDEALRGAGLSGAKAASIKDLAAKILDGSVRLDGIGRRPDEEVVDRLCEVRGIGRWTAEMFLMFTLGRPDVWPTGDYGVRKGWAIVHGRPDALPTPKELEVVGDAYRPYRSVAAWYCWRAMEVSPPAPGW
jgi:3-methyladenine DNA glycosylase/8-oxoguanine DNA glycosylase